MRILYICLIVFTSIFIGGCGGYQASPHRVGNNYYLVGDDNCRRGREIRNGVVECYDANGNYTGTRSAMTQQDMYMWNARRQQEIAEQQMINQQMYYYNMQQQMQNLNNRLYLNSLGLGY
ncbi:MAG: hypothetical protein K6E40_06000 [Desulfovibrio sp.]|nr:hypothetical protein [Desulfovibrio sp.]